MTRRLRPPLVSHDGSGDHAGPAAALADARDAACCSLPVGLTGGALGRMDARRQCAEGGICAEPRDHDASVLFADLRGFTGLAEERSPAEVLRLVNRCFAVLIRCVLAESGHLDKLLGDGLMAVFGLPAEQRDHAGRALRAARAMQAGIARLAPSLRADGWEHAGLGVGIESGRVVAGRVGVPGWEDDTVLGDVVNVAARLTAGAAPGEIVLGPGAARAVGVRDDLTPLGLIPIRGRRQPVAAWRAGPEAPRDDHRPPIATAPRGVSLAWAPRGV